MAGYITDVKNKYINNLAIYNQNDRVKELLEQDETVPIFKPLIVHEDEEPIVQEHNTMLQEICLDINGLNADISSLACEYYDLIADNIDYINNIKLQLNNILDIENDLNMLCSAYSGYNSVIQITNNEITNASEDIDSISTDNIFHINELSSEKINLTSTNVSGNGYSGNNYVYNNNNEKYLYETFDTSQIESILNVNSKNGQYYEYSRLISNNNSIVSCGDVNYDDNSVKCSIYLKSDSIFNIIKIDSEQNNLRIVDMYTSLDGASYTVLKDFHNFEYNNKNNKYNTENYIIGSGIFNIPDSKYIKITLESNEYDSEENIAYQNKKIENGFTIETTESLNNVLRYKIKINSIQAYRKTYETQSVIETNELINDSTKDITSIALFANEYLPNNIVNDNLEINDYIQYYLILNETEYKIVPINRESDNKNIKIIKIKNNLIESTQIIYVSEDIKSIKLRTVLNNINKHNSPYISNLKLLIAEEKGDEK